MDGVTKEQYGQNLWGNLQGLHERLKAKQYRHQPIRRVHIPKEKGKTRPIGISAFEDRVVQDAVREVLDAVYEQDFLNCSYGFRPGCSAHDAIRALDQEVRRGQVNWILEADIVSYFDSLDRTELKKLLQLRVADGPLLQLFRDKAPMRGARVLQRHVMTFGITAVAEGTQEEEDCQGSKKTRFVRVYRKDADDWKLVSNVQIVPETDPGALSTNP